MKLYVIRHVPTGKIMPLMRRGKGYSHWNPSNGEGKLSCETDTPRVFVSRESANRAIVQWFHNPNATVKYSQGYFGEQDETYDSKPDGRKKEDLRVVVMRFEEVEDDSL